ncbi:unnamed protein product [Echinostoma caproni]|uniref:Uncharacterized protein n=1 Tax=Echinostoma caproni TaxID=27848 RepID=A0A183AWC2_9TREM|nr:unnamed protein product [Echinostoma caproni]
MGCGEKEDGLRSPTGVCELSLLPTGIRVTEKGDGGANDPVGKKGTGDLPSKPLLCDLELAGILGLVLIVAGMLGLGVEAVGGCLCRASGSVTRALVDCRALRGEEVVVAW